VPATPPTALSDDRRVEPVVAGNAVDTVAAAWRPTTGDPVEVRVRARSGEWSPVTPIGGRNARDPAVAVSPDGTAWIAVQAYDPRRRPSVTVHSSRDGWRTAETVSAPDAGARRPRIAVDARGTVTAVWVRDAGTNRGIVQAATRPPDGGWTAPVTISAEGLIGRTALAVAPDGSAVAAWEDGDDSDRRIIAAVRTGTNTWAAASILSEPGRYSADPAVAVHTDGRAAAAWVTDRGREGAEARVATATDGTWAASTTVDTGEELALEMSRPGRALTGPAIAIAPDGRMAAAWSLTDGGVTSVRAAEMADDRWSRPVTVSGEGQAGGVSVALGPGGRPFVGWEEIDDGLLRARVTALDAPGRCRDLTPPAGETAGVRLAGGARPVAVLIDLNDSGIVAVDLP